jgi:hypothetical protein
MNKTEVGVLLDIANRNDGRGKTIRYVRDFGRKRQGSIIVSVPNFQLLKRCVLRCPNKAL